MPRKEEEAAAGAPEWMCTFSDMMSLLLCFFVLLFSMSSLEKKKIIQAMGSMRGAFGGLPAPYMVENIPDKHTNPEMSRPSQSQRKKSYAKDDLRVEEQRKVRAWNLQNVIQVTGTEQGITFRLSGDALFDHGKSELSRQGIVALNYIASEMIQFPSNPINIEGHTDNTKSSNNPDGNWLLGAERAYNVMRFLVDIGCRYGQVNEQRFTYQSYAEFKPVAGEVSQETPIQQAMNRRVDVTLIQTDEGDGTYFFNPLEANPRTPLIYMEPEGP